MSDVKPVLTPEQIAREVMADWLGIPVEDCNENSRGALLIREGIRRFIEHTPETTNG